MSKIHFYGPEFGEAMARSIATADVSNAVDAARIPDSPAFSVESCVRHEGPSKGDLDGSYYIETSRTKIGSFDPSETAAMMSQTFGVNCGGEDLEIIRYSNDSKGTRVTVDDRLFRRINAKDISIFDFVHYDPMLSMIHELKDGTFSSDDLLDRPFDVLFMQQSGRWIVEKSPWSEATYTHYMVEEHGDLVTVRTKLLPDGTTNRTIEVSDGKRHSLPTTQITRDGGTGETKICKPSSTKDVLETSRTLTGILNNAILI
ncbi:hypothetical protein A3F37_02635 [Candidatus Saccharibacteria bacterium RIFCSPHIGHO2_12_FULL_41_12]|nr:MAG: hypothetical protein A3F37_02635 [Candidatus Saccharibacteria bacterium RIFCSPHIGHO2_12_FULL_41_12]